MQQKINSIFFALLSAEIKGEKLSSEIVDLITPKTLPDIYRIAKFHDLVPIIANILERESLLESFEKAKKIFLSERKTALANFEKQKYEIECVSEIFDSENIDYILLKGAVIKELYPYPWMRTSCDIDILVKEIDLEKCLSLLENRLNYVKKGNQNYHDVSLFSPGGVHLELHYSILEDNDKVDAVLSRVWDYTYKASTGSAMIMENEFFVFYHLAHILYHFKAGGCGIRPLLDLFIMQSQSWYPAKKIEELCASCGLTKFYKVICNLLEFWFLQQEPDSFTLLVSDYLLKAGVYGTDKNRGFSNAVKKGSRFKYFISCIFLPYENMVILYPKLKNKKALLPFYQVRRWLSKIFRRKKHNKTFNKLQGDGTGFQKIKDMFDYLEI